MITWHKWLILNLTPWHLIVYSSSRFFVAHILILELNLADHSRICKYIYLLCRKSFNSPPPSSYCGQSVGVGAGSAAEWRVVTQTILTISARNLLELTLATVARILCTENRRILWWNKQWTVVKIICFLCDHSAKGKLSDITRKKLAWQCISGVGL